MNWLSFAAMNGQHAPTSWPTVSGRQSLRSVPRQTASINRNLRLGHTSAAMSARLSTVKTEFRGPLSSRARTQAPVPSVVRGGGFGPANSLRTKPPGVRRSIMVSTLHHPHMSVVPVHQQAGAERERQVDRHGDGDDLDRLPGLIER